MAVFEALSFLLHLAEAVRSAREIVGLLKEDPRIIWTLAILVFAGGLVAILIRRVRRNEPPFLSIRESHPAVIRLK